MKRNTYQQSTQHVSSEFVLISLHLAKPGYLGVATYVCLVFFGNTKSTVKIQKLQYTLPFLKLAQLLHGLPRGRGRRGRRVFGVRFRTNSTLRTQNERWTAGRSYMKTLNNLNHMKLIVSFEKNGQLSKFVYDTIVVAFQKIKLPKSCTPNIQ